VLDASECPPTFGVSPQLVQGVIAGGYEALYKAVEASEDDVLAGAKDLQMRGVSSQDVVVGIAASGNTPYTIGAIEFARKIGCLTVALTCNPDSKIVQMVDFSIVPIVGPEVIAGSSRMKAGTSHKIILNMISTETMIQLGYVAGNRMTNVQPRNEKLKQRSLRILMAETNLEVEAATALMNQANNDLRVALVMQKAQVPREAAEEALQNSQYIVESAIKTVS
jgi:N-acetylmuramic acid 6-phosphate etherase